MKLGQLLGNLLAVHKLRGLDIIINLNFSVKWEKKILLTGSIILSIFNIILKYLNSQSVFGFQPYRSLYGTTGPKWGSLIPIEIWHKNWETATYGFIWDK